MALVVYNMSAVAEHIINLGHRIQQHHTAILSTKPRYMERIITTPLHTFPCFS
jgi:hypothetical protein